LITEFEECSRFPVLQGPWNREALNVSYKSSAQTRPIQPVSQEENNYLLNAKSKRAQQHPEPRLASFQSSAICLKEESQIWIRSCTDCTLSAFPVVVMRKPSYFRATLSPDRDRKKTRRHFAHWVAIVADQPRCPRLGAISLHNLAQLPALRLVWIPAICLSVILMIRLGV